MKKIIHYIFIIIAVVFVINIIQIISLGLSNLSEFGYGALVGKLLLLLVSIFVVFKTRIKKQKTKN
ncbi:hypothetical protein ACFR98_08395 [Gelatiniphilus marinus]